MLYNIYYVLCNTLYVKYIAPQYILYNILYMVYYMVPKVPYRMCKIHVYLHIVFNTDCYWANDYTVAMMFLLLTFEFVFDK